MKKSAASLIASTRPSPLHPAKTCPTQVGTWRVGDYQVPCLPQQRPDISLDMPVRYRGFRIEKVTGPGIMSLPQEGISHHAAELTGYEDSHTITPTFGL
jgi:hypothetical protein